MGDPKQAIYSFRGADIFAYMGAAKATEARHTLLENYRSEPPLIKAVNSIFTFRELPFVFEEIPFSSVQAAQKDRDVLTEKGAATPPLKFWFTPRKEQGKPINKGDAWDMLPEAVASEICRLLRSGAKGELKIGDRGIEPGDIAVLVRANRQARLMQRALTRRGIPSVLCSAGNLFEAEEAAELLRILSAVAEPGNEALLRGALATDLTGVSGDELARLMGDERDWEQVLEEFRSYHETWKASGCMAMALRFMERRLVRERLLSAPLGERRLTNLLHTVETLHQAQVEGQLGMEGVIAWLACRITEEPKREEHEIRLETDEAAVQLVTIHKSKGLEYPIVFLPFCWSEFSGNEEGAFFHDESGRVVLDIGSPDLNAHKALARREALAENLRLLYVALTRSKHRTYLVWGAFKDAGDSAMHYLLHGHSQPAKGQVTLSDDLILDELRKLSKSSDHAIEVLSIPDADREVFRPQTAAELNLQPRKFSGAIAKDWRVASFTSLATRHHDHAELPDRDDAHEMEEQRSTEMEPAGIFAFPRGAKAGIFLHEIFEEFDFKASPEALDGLVKELLDNHGFAAEWKSAVSSMVLNVLHAPMGEGGFNLAQIGLDRRLTELEFFFPLAAISSERLRDAVSRYAEQRLKSPPAPLHKGGGGDAPLSGDKGGVGRCAESRDEAAFLSAVFSRLSFTPMQGMLRGFMDLVVEHGGRYYILDWKSNHLGNRVEDYDEPGMRREMEQNLYPLQYLLYTVALHNYLQLRVPDYDYDRHFGGVFYVFLRGVDGKGNGVFTDRPPKGLIEELSSVLVGKTSRPAPARPLVVREADELYAFGKDGQGVLPFA